LEGGGLGGVVEGDGDGDFPGFKLGGVWDFAGVVFTESFLEVLGDADLMGIGLGEGVEEVDVVKGHGSSVRFFGERPPVLGVRALHGRDLRS
jgi:hypothetical protein